MFNELSGQIPDKKSWKNSIQLAQYIQEQLQLFRLKSNLSQSRTLQRAVFDMIQSNDCKFPSLTQHPLVYIESLYQVFKDSELHARMRALSLLISSKAEDFRNVEMFRIFELCDSITLERYNYTLFGTIDGVKNLRIPYPDEFLEHPLDSVHSLVFKQLSCQRTSSRQEIADIWRHFLGDPAHVISGINKAYIYYSYYS
jgi:hypothetical protein